MRKSWKTRTLIFSSLLLLATTVYGVKTDGPQEGDPSTQQLVFLQYTQLDTVTKFPNLLIGETQVVRTGTITGRLNGSITTNSAFDLSVPLPNFRSTSSSLIVDRDGDQILLKEIDTGQFIMPLTNQTCPTLPTDIIFLIPGTPFGAAGAFTGTINVLQATGKYTSLVGQTWTSRGVGTLPAQTVPPLTTTPPPTNLGIGTVFQQVYRPL
jgi:hypothetical protein